MKEDILTDELPPLDEIFTVRTANQWLQSSKQRPMPAMLFGEFWLEGELAILFADTGKGKSILATQIAESIARGRPIAPLENTAPAQKVLYLDFELSEKQFEMRYAAEGGPSAARHLKNHYRFSEKLTRVEIDLNAPLPKCFRTFDDYLHNSVERLLAASGAKVLIVDNLTYLKRSNESTREALPLMKELKRLKKKFDLSILVLAHTPKRSHRRPITVNDLQGSKVLSNFADNIFAIGESRRESGERYIKQIKPRSTELIYDSSHVPAFCITRIGGNFLGFEFRSFEPERALLEDRLETSEWAVIERIKQLSDKGLTVRKIADELNMSKSGVHRKLQMWKPGKAKRPANSGTDHRSQWCPPPAAADQAVEPASIEGESYRGEWTDRYLQSCGIAPVWKHAAHGTDHADDAETDAADKADERELTDAEALADLCAQFDGEAESAADDTGDRAAAASSGPVLTPMLDEYDKLILVQEVEHYNGERKIWYKQNSRGVWQRYHRRLFVINVENCDGEEQTAALIRQALNSPAATELSQKGAFIL